MMIRLRKLLLILQDPAQVSPPLGNLPYRYLPCPIRCTPFHSTLSILKKYYIYLFERDRDSEREHEWEGG